MFDFSLSSFKNWPVSEFLITFSQEKTLPFIAIKIPFSSVLTAPRATPRLIEASESENLSGLKDPVRTISLFLMELKNRAVSIKVSVPCVIMIFSPGELTQVS
jgi:hypothetical protein